MQPHYRGAYTSAMPAGLVSLPLAARELRATEARLEAIYNAARLGLKGDSLALAAGMLPIEYRRLCEMDPLADLAAQKGRADNEAEMSGVLMEAARNGDSRAALEVLRYQHGWTAKTAVEVSVEQRISITAALEAAQGRVENGRTYDMEPLSLRQPVAEAR